VAGRDSGIFDCRGPEHGGVSSLSQRAITRCGQCIEPSGGYGRRPSGKRQRSNWRKRNCFAYPAHCWTKLRLILTGKRSLSVGLEKSLWATARQDVTPFVTHKVKALIIEDSPLTLDNYRNIVNSSRDMFGLWLSLKKSAQSEQELSLALADAYKNYPGVTSAWIAFFAGCLWQLDPTYFNALLHDFDGFTEGYDYQNILAKIDCPVLFLRGETKLGAVMTDDEISWLQQNFGNAQCSRIDGVGHLLHLQDEGQTPVLTAMRTFLDRV
jgi:pimeloyl-ACP methyl ester carboxylesterase